MLLAASASVGDAVSIFEHAFPARRVAVGMALMVLITVLAANQLNAFIYFRF